MAKGLLIIFAILFIGFLAGFAVAYKVILLRADCTSQKVFETPGNATGSAVMTATPSAH